MHFPTKLWQDSIRTRLLLLLGPVFSHHFMVWLSAEQVYPGKKFTDYAVLGDDVLITDELVAKAYAAFGNKFNKCGIKISEIGLRTHSSCPILRLLAHRRMDRMKAGALLPRRRILRSLRLHCLMREAIFFQSRGN